MPSAARARPHTGGPTRFHGVVTVAVSLFAVACGVARLLSPSALVSETTTILGTAACAVLFVLLVTARRRGTDEAGFHFPELNPNPIAEIDEDGVVRVINTAARALFPDLERTGASHAWLGGLERTSGAWPKDPMHRAVRELEYGGRWYHQDLVLTPYRHPRLRVYGFDITESKRAEARHRESASILRNLLDHSPDFIFIKDRQLRTILCNPLFAASTGRRPEDLYGKTDIENGSNPEFVRGNLERGIRGYEQDDLDTLSGKIVRAEREPITSPEGEPRYLDTVKVPLRDEAGTITGLLGIGRDVTAQVRLQQSLEKERTLLVTLVNGLPDLVYAKDRQGRFILANRADANFMGAGDPADLIGKTDYDFYKGEVADAFSADDRLVIEQGISIVNKEEPNTSALGELRWILTTKVPLRDETGAIIGLVGTGHDITGRKMAEHKSREQATLLDIVPDAIFVRDMGHRIRYWNKGAERIYGWTQAEVLGRNAIEVLFASPHSTEPIEAFRQTREVGEWSGDFHTVTRDGRALVVEARWILVRDATRQPTGILVVNTDVTERRSTQLQLLRVQRLESLGILAGGIAHDLNNVLTPVLMGVEGLSGPSHEPGFKEDPRHHPNRRPEGREHRAAGPQLRPRRRGRSRRSAGQAPHPGDREHRPGDIPESHRRRHRCPP